MTISNIFCILAVVNLTDADR